MLPHAAPAGVHALVSHDNAEEGQRVPDTLSAAPGDAAAASTDNKDAAVNALDSDLESNIEVGRGEGKGCVVLGAEPLNIVVKVLPLKGCSVLWFPWREA